MNSGRFLVFIWCCLLLLTLISVLMGETGDFGTFSAVLVCAIVSLKGRLVIDYLMGLRHANARIRAVMLNYFYLIPLLIVVGVVFPDVIVRLTTLG